MPWQPSFHKEKATAARSLSLIDESWRDRKSDHEYITHIESMNQKKIPQTQVLIQQQRLSNFFLPLLQVAPLSQVK